MITNISTLGLPIEHVLEITQITQRSLQSEREREREDGEIG